VRRVAQGAVWHPAKDGLAGTEPEYGDYSHPTSDSTFNVRYSQFLKDKTEFLFSTGEWCLWFSWELINFFSSISSFDWLALYFYFFETLIRFLISLSHISPKFSTLALAGDKSSWLITTYDQITNGGKPIDKTNPRSVTKSSSSSAKSKKLHVMNQVMLVKLI
jgi:hypothetical protein